MTVSATLYLKYNKKNQQLLNCIFKMSEFYDLQSIPLKAVKNTQRFEMSLRACMVYAYLALNKENLNPGTMCYA